MQNPIPLLRTANLVEAVSYALLVFVAMPLKYGCDMPLPVRVMGWIHGLLFAVFCWALVRVVHDGGWPVRRVALLFVAALLPIVPFFVDRRFGPWIAEWRPRSGE